MVPSKAPRKRRRAGLLEVLSDYRCPAMELYAVFAPGKPVPPRIRLFVDHLVHAFKRQEGHLIDIPNWG
jgi:DNA-binding transcriptional LysR family regulator